MTSGRKDTVLSFSRIECLLFVAQDNMFTETSKIQTMHLL